MIEQRCKTHTSVLRLLDFYRATTCMLPKKSLLMWSSMQLFRNNMFLKIRDFFKSAIFISELRVFDRNHLTDIFKLDALCGLLFALSLNIFFSSPVLGFRDVFFLALFGRMIIGVLPQGNGNKVKPYRHCIGWSQWPRVCPACGVKVSFVYHFYWNYFCFTAFCCNRKVCLNSIC